jgi:hypothetical protein
LTDGRRGRRRVATRVLPSPVADPHGPAARRHVASAPEAGHGGSSDHDPVREIYQRIHVCGIERRNSSGILAFDRGRATSGGTGIRTQGGSRHDVRSSPAPGILAPRSGPDRVSRAGADQAVRARSRPADGLAEPDCRSPVRCALSDVPLLHSTGDLYAPTRRSAACRVLKRGEQLTVQVGVWSTGHRLDRPHVRGRGHDRRGCALRAGQIATPSGSLPTVMGGDTTPVAVVITDTVPSTLLLVT